MNYKCSYRRLLGNGKSALLAAIEIYNKPRIEYRDECFVILLLNAWELIIKAVLSKNGERICYPKRRNEPYRTYSLADAFRRAEKLIPDKLVIPAIRLNLELLGTYRDNSVHFYNAPKFGTVIYALAQTNILNLKDLLLESFRMDLSNEITWQLLPLGLESPIDPIEYISRKGPEVRHSSAVTQFLGRIAESTKSLEDANLDTARLLTVFKVNLVSTKKIGNADVIVGIQAVANQSDGPLVITKSVDPNITHPLRTKELLKKVGTVHNQTLTSNAFQAIAWKFELKSKPNFCWRSSTGGLVKYSHDAVAFIKRLKPEDIQLAKDEYRDRDRKKASANASISVQLSSTKAG